MTYLERLENGEDARVLLLEASKDVELGKKALNEVLDRVLEGGDICGIITDIVDIIPTEFIESDGDI